MFVQQVAAYRLTREPSREGASGGDGVAGLFGAPGSPASSAVCSRLFQSRADGGRSRADGGRSRAPCHVATFVRPSVRLVPESKSHSHRYWLPVDVFRGFHTPCMMHFRDKNEMSVYSPVLATWKMILHICDASV